MQRQLNTQSFSLIVLLILIAQTAQAKPAAHHLFASDDTFPPQFEYFVDATGTHNIDTVSQLPDGAFQSAPRAGYVGGYNRNIHWLRFTLPASESAGEPLFMRVMPTYSDFITLYLPDNAREEEGFIEQRSGELVEDWNNKADRAFTFKFPSAERPRTLYLRLESRNSAMLVANIYTHQSYLRAIQIDNLLSGAFLGLLLTLLGINISHGKWRVDVSFRRYLVFILASLTTFISNNGWLAMWAPSEWRSWVIFMPQVTTLLYILALALFYHSLFRFSRQRSPFSFWISHSYLFIAGLGFIALWLDFYIEYMPTVMSVTIVYLIWITAIALGRVIDQKGEARLLFLASALGFSGVLGTALSLNGLLSGGVWLMYSYTGGILASIVVFQGIMGRRIQQMEKQHLRAVVERQHAETIAMRERHEKEQKAQFISMLSHELKTPLSVISLGISQENPSRNARNHVQQAIGDMSRIIDRCAVLEQVDGEVQTRKETVELVSIINILIHISRAEQQVRWQPQAACVQIESDPDWLRVILSNLLDNALKYNHQSEKVDIILSESADRILIEVSNWTSDPLPDGDRVFNKYYREKSARKRSGSGLGLYIVKQLVNQLGGSITYHGQTQIIASNDGGPTALNPTENLSRVTMSLCLPKPN